jgi:alginate O-acetyltransferase complex protein AlgI
MLFNSVEFIFLFLPGALALYVFGGQIAGPSGARVALLIASLFFYAWWDIRFLPILIISCLVNYVAGLTLASTKFGDRSTGLLLAAAVLINLFGLGYFKYIAFLTTTFKDFFIISVAVPAPLLPLGISFFTFHQITYIVHVCRTGRAERDPVRYGLFVAFFPQLLAGPITYAREMLPQFSNPALGRLIPLNVAVGLTIFVIGLLKKVVLADSVAHCADAVFGASAQGVNPTLLEAWFGILAYAFQIYFDFSGYSDMAIGLARMFGIKLPLNFHSPYKAKSIIEFWQRWHISLSRFLRDYLYIPLGGNRRGRARWLVNLLVTMLLGGLWHGAGWTFVVWGGLHGVYLVVNHLWRWMTANRGPRYRPSWLAGLTFPAVCVAWVYFRASDLGAANILLRAMAGEFGAVVPAYLLADWPSVSRALTTVGLLLGTPTLLPDRIGLLSLAGCAAVVWLMPNTQQIVGRYGNAIDTYGHLEEETHELWWQWRPTKGWGAVCALAMAAAFLTFDRPARFLYFQF